MRPVMTSSEFNLFVAFVKSSDNYVEFGTGGSTFIASQNVSKSVTSVDSSEEWLYQVSQACSGNSLIPELLHVDIGSTGDWGFPNDPASRDKWPTYHSAIWSKPERMNADLYLVDGRFRVACFAQIVMRCDASALIGFHDFASRSYYHPVKEIAREIAVAEDLSFFQPLPGSRGRAIEMMNKFMFEPG